MSMILLLAPDEDYAASEPSGPHPSGERPATTERRAAGEFTRPTRRADRRVGSERVRVRWAG